MSELNVKMQNGYIMIKDLEMKDRVTESGILIPREKYQRVAKVVAVPEGEAHFKVGDTILKPVGRGTPVNIGGVDYECVKSSIVFALL